MAAEEEKDINLEQEGQGKSNMMLYIGIFVGQVIIAAAIMFFYVMPKLNPGDGSGAAAENPAEATPVLELSYRLSNLTVNPRNTMGRRFAVFEIVMDVSSEIGLELLKKREPILRDRFINYLRSMSIAELSMEKTMDAGRQKLLTIANETIENELVTEVYFTRFVLQ